ncbi:MAG: ABC transporter permease [Lachnospiraceae bacterium]|nr:ABC transporter permease [Lachnospiraceae bacterium]
MGRAWMWFFLSCKRHLHRKSFLVILLLLPVGTFLIRGSQKEGEAGLDIAVCAEQGTEGSLEQQLAEALAERQEEKGLFRFYLCEDEQQVKDEVASRRAECGYVISEGLKEKLDRHDFKRSIRVYSAPSTIAASLSSETVFAAMIEKYDPELFGQYVAEKLQEAGVEKEAGLLYDKWRENGSTFHFTYEYVDRQGEATKEVPEAMVFPVRGIVAVYLFVIGLYSAAMSLADERRGLFLAVPYGSRSLCRMAAMGAPVFLAAVSGYLALLSGGTAWHMGFEMTALAFYGILVTGFSWAVRIACPREALVCCLIPFFLVGSLVFCPVFLDIGKYVPEFGKLGNLFLPQYYLKIFG